MRYVSNEYARTPCGQGNMVVAVKRINTMMLKQRLLENLELEIQIMTRMNHPNIIQLYDEMESAEHMYLVMEYCEAGDLSHYIKARNTSSTGAVRAPMDLHMVRSVGQQVGSAIIHLNTHNIIHRDIKPQNVLLQVQNDGSLCFKVADFGFARYLESELAATLCGSPLYMAPEILASQPYGWKADLWSIGTVLYECVTGKPPFTASNHIELSNVIKRTWNTLHFPEDIDPDLKSLLRHLLQPDPNLRMDANEFFSHPFLDLKQYQDSVVIGDDDDSSKHTDMISSPITKSPPIPISDLNAIASTATAISTSASHGAHTGGDLRVVEVADVVSIARQVSFDGVVKTVGDTNLSSNNLRGLYSPTTLTSPAPSSSSILSADVGTGRDVDVSGVVSGSERVSTDTHARPGAQPRPHLSGYNNNGTSRSIAIQDATHTQYARTSTTSTTNSNSTSTSTSNAHTHTPTSSTSHPVRRGSSDASPGADVGSDVNDGGLFRGEENGSTISNLVASSGSNRMDYFKSPTPSLGSRFGSLPTPPENDTTMYFNTYMQGRRMEERRYKEDISGVGGFTVTVNPTSNQSPSTQRKRSVPTPNPPRRNPFKSTTPTHTPYVGRDRSSSASAGGTVGQRLSGQMGTLTLNDGRKSPDGFYSGMNANVLTRPSTFGDNIPTEGRLITGGGGVGGGGRYHGYGYGYGSESSCLGTSMGVEFGVGDSGTGDGTRDEAASYVIIDKDNVVMNAFADDLNGRYGDNKYPSSLPCQSVLANQTPGVGTDNGSGRYPQTAQNYPMSLMQQQSKRRSTMSDMPAAISNVFSAAKGYTMNLYGTSQPTTSPTSAGALKTLGAGRTAGENSWDQRYGTVDGRITETQVIQAIEDYTRRGDVIVWLGGKYLNRGKLSVSQSSSSGSSSQRLSQSTAACERYMHLCALSLFVRALKQYRLALDVATAKIEQGRTITVAINHAVQQLRDRYNHCLTKAEKTKAKMLELMQFVGHSSDRMDTPNADKLIFDYTLNKLCKDAAANELLNDGENAHRMYKCAVWLLLAVLTNVHRDDPDAMTILNLISSIKMRQEVLKSKPRKLL
eukprot:CFRG4337T1